MMNFVEMIPKDWWEAIAESMPKEDLQILDKRISIEYESNNDIYPKHDQIFQALWLTPLSEVKVVILGQDPYPGAGQAHGLAFSVPPGVRIPRSLKNIFTCLANDLQIQTPESGCLASWAQNGVLLLNSVLSVQANRSRSHHRLGWQALTTTIIQIVSAKRLNTAFLLWGRDAQTFKRYIRKDIDHLVLETSHPAPYSARLGFLDCKHFSSVNKYRNERDLQNVDWTL